MHDLADIKGRATALMDRLGREQEGASLRELGWTVRFDGAKRRLGLCKWKRRGRVVRVISLSRHYARQHGRFAHRFRLHIVERETGRVVQSAA